MRYIWQKLYSDMALQGLTSLVLSKANGAMDLKTLIMCWEKNSPTVAYACRKRRLKWVLPQVGGWSTGLATLSL